MSRKFSLAQNLVLQCCAAPDRDMSEQMAALDRKGESELLDLALQTRAAGLLHRASTGLEGGLRDQLSLIAKQYSLHNLRVGQVLVEVVDLLADEGLAPIALKGVALAFGDYPDTQLRPLRDIDLLLEPAAAMAAQELLLSTSGFRYADKAGRYGIEHSHQLPEIVHVRSGVILEVHHRLNARGWPHEQRLLSMIVEEAGTLEILGRVVRVPSPETNLLHLLEHATVHHAFANGPLVLSDMHFLAKNEQAIGPGTEGRVDGLGLTNAFDLLSQIARNLGAQWPEQNAIQDSSAVLVDDACTAMLMTEEHIAQHDQVRRLKQMDGSSWGRILRSMRPDPNELAKHSTWSVDSPIKWMGYPSWLVEKGTRYWRGHHNKYAQTQFRARDAVISWLEQ